MTLAALCVLLLPHAAFAEGKGHGVEVRAFTAGMQQAVPGQIISLSFRVTNGTDREQELQESLQLPADWQGIIPVAVFTLRPQEFQARIIAFSIPASAPAGDYEVTYSVRSQADYGVQDAETVAVVVLPLSKLTMLIEEKPEVVIAGDEYHVKLRLINQGNALAPVRLVVTSDPNYPAQVDVTDLELPARTDRVVTLTGQTDRNERRMDQHTIQVKALEPKSGELKAAVAVSFEVVPRMTGRPDLRHRLPVRLSLRASGGDGGMRLQPELSGSGTLDEAGTKKVDFLFRGPDTHESGLFGRRDESWLDYYAPNLDLLLGDQSYGLSRLTEYYRYGRGTALDVTAGHSLGFGAYHLASRWEWPHEQQVGAYLKKSFNRDWLRLNVLNRERGGTDAAPPLNASIWSLEGAVHPARDIGLSAEYGRSRRDEDRVSDDAYRIELEGGARSRYQLSKIHAGADYQGYYRDCDYLTGAVTFPVGTVTEARAAYAHWEQNLEQRPDQATAPRESLVQLNVSRRLESRWYLSVGYDGFRGRDSSRLAPCDYEERVLQVSAGRSSDTYNWHLELRAGRREDALAHRSDDLRCLSAFAAYRPSPRGSFTLYGGVGDSGARGSRLLGFGNNLGASVTWQPRDGFNLRVGYLRYGFDSDNQPSRSMIDSEVACVLPDETALAFRVLRNSQSLGGRPETSYMLSYTIPFGIPVSRRKSVGALGGVVYYLRSDTRTPVANAIVTVGGAGAATDGHGRFALGPLAPGRYSLSIDRASIGRKGVTAEEFPRPVQVTGGETTQVDIALVDAARVSGRVVVVPASQPDDGSAGFVVSQPDGGAGPGSPDGTAGQMRPLENVLVELANGDEVTRRVTDTNGEFMFEGLRPGKWHLLVYDYNLPAFHYLEKSELDLELTTGENKEVLIRVLPRVRRIKMIEDGKADLVIEQRSP